MHVSRTQFWYLCCLGVWGLWGTAYFNGMFDRLDTVLTDRKLADGRPVRGTYTGVNFIDQQLALVAVFYGVLTDHFSSGPRLLFFDINAVVSCTNLWVLIESRRAGVRSSFFKYPAWAIILWNLNGAAIFQPPYFYLLSRSQASQRDANISLGDSIALFACVLPIMASPLLLFLPAWTGMNIWEHHGYIALFHASPLILSAIFWAVTSLTQMQAQPGPHRHRIATKWVVSSLILAGTWAAAIHIYTLLGAVMTTDPDASLIRVFIPTHGRANPFPAWIESIPSTVEGLPSEYLALLENFHLFSQYDWIVVSLSCILFTHLLLHGRDGEDKTASGAKKSPNAAEESTNLGYLALASVLLGPGAAGSFALAIRETSLQKAPNQA